MCRTLRVTHLILGRSEFEPASEGAKVCCFPSTTAMPLPTDSLTDLLPQRVCHSSLKNPQQLTCCQIPVCHYYNPVLKSLRNLVFLSSFFEAFHLKSWSTNCHIGQLVYLAISGPLFICFILNLKSFSKYFLPIQFTLILEGQASSHIFLEGCMIFLIPNDFSLF